jgi:hypothetical protein
MSRAETMSKPVKYQCALFISHSTNDSTFDVFASRKIIIHDTSPFLFRIFLEYLYSGRLRDDSLSIEQLVELLLLSDRYEVDSLKQTCEYALQHSIDLDSALYFFNMADQYNARILKVK